MPSLGYRVSGKGVEVRGSGSRHHQLCGCCNLQLIQSHVAPSYGPPARVLSPLFILAKSLLLPKLHGKKEHSQTKWSSFLSSKTAWSSLFTLPKLRDPLPSPPKPGGPPSSPPELRGPLSLWLPCLGLNPSAGLPLQPHFQLLLQSVTPANIPVFFQLYWAAIVSPGRCGPMAWSQSSPSSHTGPVTRGSCFPVPSWVEFTPIPLAKSLGTAI